MERREREREGEGEEGAGIRKEREEVEDRGERASRGGDVRFHHRNG